MATTRRRTQKHNILITGATSTIGRHLTMHLLNDRQVGKVLGVAIEPEPYYFRDHDRSRFTYRRMNILKSRELRNLLRSKEFKDARINTVVHLAFHSQPKRRGRAVHRLNVEGTKRLLDACIANERITKFIFKSSDVVYKLQEDNPVFLDENADLNFDPDADQWIKDRVDADMICRSRMDNKTTDVVVLRFSNIIGRNVSNQLNAYFDAPFMFKEIGFNPQVNLIHMKDVIQAIKLSIFKKATGVFNIAGVDTAPISTFAELNSSRLVSLPAPLLGPMNWLMRTLGVTDYYYSVDRERMKFTCLLDITKAKEVLGFQPTGRVEFRSR